MKGGKRGVGNGKKREMRKGKNQPLSGEKCWAHGMCGKKENLVKKKGGW